MNRKLLVTAFIALFLMAGSGHVNAWSPTQNLTNSTNYAVLPRIVSDGYSNVHLVWYGYGDDSSQWKVYYQMYNGSMWSAPLAVSGSASAGSAIAVDGYNNLHVVWHAGGNPEDIYYRKCTAGVWGTIVNLSNSAGVRSLAPRIAVDSAGNNILVGWHESDQNSGNWDILAKKCTNGVWGAIENVSNDSTLSRTVDIVVDTGGSFHLAWEDTDNSHIWYRKRNTDGSYGSKTSLDTNSGRSYGVALCISPNGYIHAAWHDNNDDWDVVYRYFNGTSWSAVTNASNNPGVTDCGASLAADSNNQIYLIWHDYANIYYAHTVGGVWKPWYKLSRGNVQQTGTILVNGNGTKHVVWPSRDPGNWDTMWSWESTVDVTPPGQVSSLTVQAKDSQVTLNWTNPSDVDYRGTMLRYKTTGYPTGPTDGTLLFDRSGVSPGSLDNYVHTGLTNNTTYYYAFFTYDVEPNYTVAYAAGTPMAGPKANLLQNPRMDVFSSGVATYWTAYRVNDNNVLNFISDSGTNHFVSPPSQGITGVESVQLPYTGLSAAGIYQVVPGVTPGKVYQFVGSQDLYCGTWGAAGQRYLLNFGINPAGATAPGTPGTDGTIGGCQWMTASQACWNNMSAASPVYFSGFHRSTAAFPATSTSISVWSGLTINNPGARDALAAQFNTDDHYLYEWDFPANASLVNGDFEGGRTDLQNGGDIIPDGWIPAGGGVGQWNVWLVTNATVAVRSGAYGMQIANRRGTVNAGFMQKIAVSPGTNYKFSAYIKTTGQDNTTGAVGIDPYGGGDITGTNVVWTTTKASVWTLLEVTAIAQLPAVTVFIRTSNTNADGDAYHHTYADDCAFSTAAPSGTISGAVTDSCGNPISGATVSTDAGGYTTATASNGSYSLSPVLVGAYTVTASKSGYGTSVQSGVAVNNAQTTTVNFSLSSPPSGMISGIVKDDANNPISGAAVSTQAGGYATTSGTNGAYTLSGVTPGLYAVTASVNGRLSQTQVDVNVTNCQTATVNFNLAAVPVIWTEHLINGNFEGGFGNFWGGQMANPVCPAGPQCWGATWRDQFDDAEWTDYVFGGDHGHVVRMHNVASGFEAGIIQQAVGLAPGATYRFIADAYQYDQGSNCWIGTDPNGGTTMPSRVTNFPNITNQWNTMEVTGAVGSSGVVSVYLWNWHQWGAGADAYFDNASLLVNSPAAMPAITLSKTTLTPRAATGTNAPNQTFTVKNTGTGTLNYTIWDNATWLSVTPTSGASTGEEDTVTVQYTTSVLMAGTYHASVVVMDPNAVNSPQVIQVSLTIGAFADFNGDQHVDATDFDTFSACYNGPTNPVSGDCLVADFNGDLFVDAVDFDVFSGCYNGPTNPPRCQ